MGLVVTQQVGLVVTLTLTLTTEKIALRNEQRSKGKPKKLRLSANKVKPTKTLHKEKRVKCATKQRKVQRLNRERDCSSDKEDDDTIFVLSSAL